MSDFSFAIGLLLITPLFWGLLVAGVLSSFVLWRNLREDHREEEIFGLTIKVFFSALIFARFFFILFNHSTFGFYLAEWVSLSYGSNFSPLGAAFGAFLPVIWSLKAKKKNYWEVLDWTCFCLLIFLVFGGLGAFLTTGQWLALGYLALGFLGLGLFGWLRRRYRSFVWYKSGKTGFLAGALSSFIFWGSLVLAIARDSRLYLEPVISLLLAVISLGVIYYRSERSLKEDLRIKND